MNMLIHREYSIKAGNSIKIYQDRIEFLSIGGLLTGIAEDDIFSGTSFPRNERLVNVFCRLGFVEMYGAGLQKIRVAYAGSTVKPSVKVTTNTFKLVLPNLNYTGA